MLPRPLLARALVVLLLLLLLLPVRAVPRGPEREQGDEEECFMLPVSPDYLISDAVCILLQVTWNVIR